MSVFQLGMAIGFFAMYAPASLIAQWRRNRFAKAILIAALVLALVSVYIPPSHLFLLPMFILILYTWAFIGQKHLRT